jgi:colanic acid/amylovoran biosynthesis glycosyltransferase
MSIRLCQIHLSLDDPMETFARDHAERLPCEVSVVHGHRYGVPLCLDGRPLYPNLLAHRIASRARRIVWQRRGLDIEDQTFTRAYLTAFRRADCDAVLAEFGPVGAQAMHACKILNLPLTVYFHGYDASARPTLERFGARYREMFDQVAAMVAVSTPVREALISLGAPPEKIHYIPNGVDIERFGQGRPEEAPPVFLAVGRFVEKKGPQLTIEAFGRVRERFPEARLRMIGDGELRATCVELVQRLGLGDAVSLLGEQPHEVVAGEMRGARAFVQHSMVAADGDSEGLPIAILEASATGIPVVSTRHSGIPDVVVEGQTGYLVDERDVAGMAAHMKSLIADPSLAGELGRAGRERIAQHFTIDAEIARLWQVIQATALDGAAPGQSAP